MGAGAQVCPLRDGRGRADGDLAEIVDDGPVADRGMLADVQVPRNGDAHAGINVSVAPDPRAEGAKQGPTQSPKRTRNHRENHRAEILPYRAAHEFS